MNESTKSKQYWGAVEREAMQGAGIDIGCGPDPVLPGARRFDLEDGDANVVSQYVKEQFDFVYSSHCLEHMHDPKAAILDWWKLVKSGGYLFVVVPDEDLYEQGVFPSQFNPDHKATFTISKARSWSDKSINVLDLAHSLPGSQVVCLQLQDRGYDRSLMGFGRLRPGFFVRFALRLGGVFCRLAGSDGAAGWRRFASAFYPVDQTCPEHNAQAQIQLIVKKTG